MLIILRFRARRLSLSLLIGAIALLCSNSLAQNPSFDAEAILAVRDFSGKISVSPDGKWVAYVLPDLSDEWNILARRPRGAVHLQSLEPGQDPGLGRALTQGSERSSFPVWSRSGAELAFVSESEQGIYIKVWDVATGSVRRLERKLPTAPYLAPFWAYNDESIIVAPEIPTVESEVPRVQVLRSSQESLPGDRYFSNQQQARLWRLSTRGGRHRELYSSPVPLRSWSMSPDGRGLVYESALRPGLRREERRSYLLDLTQPVPPLPLGAIQGFRWLPNGQLVVRHQGKWRRFQPDPSGEPALPDDLLIQISVPIWGKKTDTFLTLVEDTTQHDPEIEPAQPGMFTIARPFRDLYLVSADGKTHNVSADLSDQVVSPVWSPQGDAIFFKTIDNQTYEESLWRYDLERGEKVRLLGGGFSLGDLSPVPTSEPGSDGRVSGGIIFTRESATTPVDLWILESGQTEPRRLTELNPQLEDVEFSEPELFHFENAEGDSMGALLYKPAGYQQGQKVPVITYVYEKLTPRRNRFLPRHQFFLQQGFAVLLPNVKVKVGQTGDSFVRNVVPAVEAVREMGITNGRFALWGGSFGAYATSFVITQTNIFACAVSRATPPELFRNWASGRDRDSDNIETGQARLGGSPFEVQERYFSQSAFFHLDKVETPVLIMHGKQDMTILFEEGAMMFYALRRLGKEATFVAYEHGDHSLYRHSSADALDVHRRMLDWFERYLRTEEPD